MSPVIRIGMHFMYQTCNFGLNIPFYVHYSSFPCNRQYFVSSSIPHSLLQSATLDILSDSFDIWDGISDC